MNTTLLRFGMNLWPPFLLAGIHVTHFAPDARHARVELRARPWNRNYVGTHFGGSLFAMADPFWMILILRSLGRDYLVWDQAGEIQFLKPGRGTVVAEFQLGRGHAGRHPCRLCGRGQTPDLAARGYQGRLGRGGRPGAQADLHSPQTRPARQSGDSTSHEHQDR